MKTDLNKLLENTFLAKLLADFDGKIIDATTPIENEEEIVGDMTETEKILFSLTHNQANLCKEETSDDPLLRMKFDVLKNLLWTSITDRIKPTTNLAIRDGFKIVETNECNCPACRGDLGPISMMIAMGIM